MYGLSFVGPRSRSLLAALRRRRSWRIAFLGVGALHALVPACTLLVPDTGPLSVAFYNVQNLFDAQHQGTEYAEFVPGPGWSIEDVDKKLRATATAVQSIRPRPDILALAEVENAAIVDRLRREFLPEMGFAYAVTGAEGRTAVTVALLSRYPITDARTHQQRSNVPMRPILEVWLEVRGRPVVIFVNHWKSKSGGAPATEPVRREAARTLNSRLAELDPALPVIVLGDFNSNPDEYERIGRAYPTALWPARETPLPAEALCVAESWEELQTDPLRCLFSPWFESAQPGSYLFRETWDRIDGFLLNGALADGVGWEFLSFGVTDAPALLDSRGAPRSWTPSGGGYSDHLPVWMTIELVETQVGSAAGATIVHQR